MLVHASTFALLSVTPFSSAKPMNRFEHRLVVATAGTQVFLVPGGRYLLATTSLSLMLWDLGAAAKPSGGDGTEPVMLDIMQFSGWFRISTPTVTSHGTKAVRFILAIHTVDVRAVR